MPRRQLHLLQVALGLLFLSFVVDNPGLAQRGGSGRTMGAASHSMPSFSPARGSFSHPARSAVQPFHPPAMLNHHQNQHRPPEVDHDRHRGEAVGYRASYPYVYTGYPGLLSFGYGLPFGYGSDQEESAPPLAGDYSHDLPPQENTPEVAAYDAPMFRPPYEPQAIAAPVPAQPATTLVFNDGRPALEVHNYALTGSTLYALDGEMRREIPLTQLDVSATIEANRKAGVDFALPTSH